jgi:hypothetical protein
MSLNKKTLEAGEGYVDGEARECVRMLKETLLPEDECVLC